MAKNTYKQNTSKSLNSEKEKEARPPFKFKLPSLDDRRLHLSLGFLLLFLSIYLAIAFISYIFTGKSDQSVVDSFLQTGLREAGKEIENWLGLLGAVVSHFIIFKWFGLAAFLIIPILFLIGYKIVFKKEIFDIKSFSKFSIFLIFWLSFVGGYIILSSGLEADWSFISGGIGYEVASLLAGLIGWGTILLAVFAIIVFVIYFFNVTTLMGLNNKITEAIENIEEKAHEKVDFESIENLHKEFLKEEPIDEENEEQHVIGKLTHKDPLIKDIAFSIENKIEEEPEPIINYIDLKEDNNDFPLKDAPLYDSTLDLPHYKFPNLDLMDEPTQSKVQITVEELERNKDKIVETLKNYGVGIASIKATVGPTVTLYEIIPEAGVRTSKIKNLEDDIALSLAALGIRIIAPIPGKGTIGIEVPNSTRETVSMRSLIMSEKFQRSDKDLPIVLGKTISNEIYVTDLAKMPHLLMAGATGQGKSVGLNVILTSLLYKKHPSQIKFVLVDPKKVELTLYNKIERHYLAALPGSDESIITDTKKVVNTLNSLCMEMDTRYDLLKIAECRNIKEYNKKFIERRLNPEKGHRYLPYIVLVIDELADLMMTAGKEVEHPIARLAQLARATGIHLVVATQRPSVNVITGLIKANFPARLSFKVTSKIDSRTILDTGGAEQLVGRGDMLLTEGSEIIRLQCAFLDTHEVEKICEFIGSQKAYESAYLLPEYYGDEEGGQESKDFDPNDRDPLFDEAARLIVMHQQGSTSLIQRRLKLGYNRAGRLIDQLESAGIVGHFEGSKAREVLIKDESSLEQLLRSLNGI